MYYNACSLQVQHPIRNAQVLTHRTETAEWIWPHGCPQVTYGQNKSRKQYATSITIHHGVQKRGGVDPIVIRIISLGLLHWPKKYCFQQTLGATAAVNIADIGDLKEYHKGTKLSTIVPVNFFFLKNILFFSNTRLDSVSLSLFVWIFCISSEIRCELILNSAKFLVSKSQLICKQHNQISLEYTHLKQASPK